MCKKLFMAMLMLGVCMAGYSQTNTDPMEVAKTAVEKSQMELLGKMERRLKDRNEPMPKEFGKMTEAQQFLFQENLIDSVLKAKSHGLKDVFTKLCDKSNMPSDLIYEGVSFEDITYKTIESGKKQGQIDSTTLIVPMSFQTQTIAKEGLSNVKYNTTFNWEVKLKSNKKQDTGVDYQVSSTKLISSEAKLIEFLTSEKKSMKDAAINAIIEWYNNLPQTLDKQYSNKSVSAIKAMSVSSNEITMNLPQGRTFTVSDVPTIKIDIDPYQFINENEKQLYTDPVAYMTIAPVFNVSVDDTNNKANLSVQYKEKEFVKPILDREKESRRDIANAVVTNYTQMLATYVSSRDKGQKADIENLFNKEENLVEVSYLNKKGTEKITKKTAQKYLSLLKGSGLNVVINNIEVVNSNWDTLIYTVNQEYHSKNYNDYTQKRIYLTYDSLKGTYVINKVEVVPNSTKFTD